LEKLDARENKIQFDAGGSRRALSEVFDELRFEGSRPLRAGHKVLERLYHEDIFSTFSTRA